MPLEIHLLGSPRFVVEGERLYLSRRKSIALLAYVAVIGQPQARDMIATLLWPEFDQSAARTNLRRDLSWLRRMLPDNVLAIDRLQVELNPAPDVWLDVREFEAAITAVSQHVHQSDELCDECAQRLAEAVDLYEGDFMAGFSLADSAEFEEWHFFQREEYRAKMVESLQQLISWCRGQQQYEQGIAYGRRWLALDPWHEQAHRALMTLYALTDQQAAALRQYDECVRLLEEELGIEPESETQVLFEAIRNREFGKADLKENGAEKDAGGQKPEEAAKDEILPTDFELPLPTPTTPFIGREQELANIVELLSRPETRLITVAGPGGMGKTRLALAVATAVAEQFTHGVVFLPLAPLSSAEYIPTTLANQLQLSLAGQDPKAQLLTHLQSKEMLLIMDNFEHLLADPHHSTTSQEAVGEQFVAEILVAAPQVKVLVTTRERLNLVGEMVLPIGGLTVRDETTTDDNEESGATQLFQHHARLVRPDLEFNTADYQHIHHICRLVEGMPLALVFAASWVEMLSIAEIAEEIAHDLDFLETDMVDVPERQRSVRVVFDASWRRLASEEQAVFRQLSVFRGGFTRQAAQAITGASLRTLRGLVHKLFVTLEANGRYQIHELLRQYGAEQLTAVNEQRITKQTHANYYLNMLEQREVDIRGRDQLVALKEIDADFENVRKAWGWASAQRDEAAIMQALESLHLFIENRNRYLEGISLLEQAQQRLVPDGRQSLSPTWGRLAARANFLRLISSGSFEGLAEIVETCLVIAEKANDRFEIAFGRFFYSQYLFFSLHETKSIMPHLQEALATFRDLEDAVLTVRVLNMLGILMNYESDMQQSSIYLEEAANLAKATGNLVDASVCLSNLCEIALALGDYEAGEAYASEAFLLSSQIHQHIGSGYAAVLHGVYLILKGDIDKAEVQIKGGHEKAKAINYAVTLTYAGALRSVCQSLQGNYRAALKLAEEGLVNPMNDSFGHILGHWAMAFAHLGLGEAGQTWAYVRQMIEYVQAYPSSAMLTWALPITAVLHTKNEQWETAVHHLALAHTHPLSPVGWQDKWSLLAETKAQLQSELGLAKYESIWEQGQTLALEDVIAPLTLNNLPK